MKKIICFIISSLILSMSTFLISHAASNPNDKNKSTVCICCQTELNNQEKAMEQTQKTERLQICQKCFEKLCCKCREQLMKNKAECTCENCECKLCDGCKERLNLRTRLQLKEKCKDCLRERNRTQARESLQLRSQNGMKK